MRQFHIRFAATLAVLLGACCVARVNAQCGTSVIWHDGGDPTAMLATSNRLFAAGRNLLRIYDTTNQDHPALLSTFILDGNPTAVEYAADHLYVALGDRGVEIIDITNPAAPAHLFSIAGGDATDVTITNSTLFIAWNGDLRSYDITNPAAPSFVSTLALSSLNLVESRNNIVYAAEANDLHTINVSNPAAPVIVDTISYPAGILALDARPGLVALQVSSAIHIIDVSTPAAMVEVSTINNADALNDVCEFGQIAGTPVVYFVNANNSLDAASLANPAAPAPLPVVTTQVVSTVAATAANHVYAVAYHTLSAYALSFAADPVTTEEINLSPSYLAGMGTSSSYFVAAYDAKLVVRDVTNPAAPVDVSTVMFPSGVYDLVVKDDLAFVSLGHDIRIYDLANPASPVLRSTLHTSFISAMAVDQHTLYAVSNEDNTVFSWDIADPAHPIANPPLDLVVEINAKRLIASDATVYLATPQSVRIFNASNPAQLVLASTLTPIPANVDFADIAVRGSTLVTLTFTGHVELFDVSNRAAPGSLASFVAGSAGQTVNFADSLLIVSDYSYPSYAYLIDAADPANPVLLPQTLRAPAPLGRINATLGTTFWSSTLSSTGIDAYRLPGAPRVAIDPVDTPACASTGTASLSVTLANAPNASFQWRKGGVDLNNGPTAWGSTISGAHAATLTITDGAVQDLGLYDCVITNQCGSTTTRDARLFPGIPPTIFDHPHDAQACPAGSALFSTAWLGTLPATFQWEAEFPINSGTYVAINDTTTPRFTISGATTRELSISANVGQTFPVALVQTRYRCVVTNACAATTTNAASLTILDAGEWACLGCAPCPADYDQDGGVTGSDLAAFFTEFEQGLTCADVDQDGGITGGDVAAFFAAFEAGGC